MLRTTGYLGCASALALFACPAVAEDDVQGWLYLNASGAVGEDGRLLLEFSPRARDQANGDEQTLTRITYDHRLNEHVTVGGGVAYVFIDGGDEFRPAQQLTLTSGVFQARTRLEQRFFSGADRMGLRARQRFQLTLPVARGTTASGSGELLYTVRSQNDGGQEGVDSWRARLSIQHALTPRLEVTGAYLLMLSPRGPREDQWSHVPQLAITWRW